MFTLYLALLHIKWFFFFFFPSLSLRQREVIDKKTQTFSGHKECLPRFISRRPVRQIALGRKADHISQAYLPPSGSGQPRSPWDVQGRSGRPGWAELSGLGWPGAALPQAFDNCSLPSLWFRKLSFFPSVDDSVLSLSNYLLLFIWNPNIWEALRDQICGGHRLLSGFMCAGQVNMLIAELY